MGYEYGMDDNSVDDYGYGDEPKVDDDNNDYGYGIGAPDDYGYGANDDVVAGTNAEEDEDYGYGDETTSAAAVVVPAAAANNNSKTNVEYGYIDGVDEYVVCSPPLSTTATATATSHRLKRRCSVTKYNLENSNALTAADRIKELRDNDSVAVASTTMTTTVDDYNNNNIIIEPTIESQLLIEQQHSVHTQTTSISISPPSSPYGTTEPVVQNTKISSSLTPNTSGATSTIKTTPIVTAPLTTTTTTIVVPTKKSFSSMTSTASSSTGTKSKKEDNIPTMKKKGVISRMRKRLSLAF